MGNFDNQLLYLYKPLNSMFLGRKKSNDYIASRVLFEGSQLKEERRFLREIFN